MVFARNLDVTLEVKHTVRIVVCCVNSDAYRCHLFAILYVVSDLGNIRRAIIILFINTIKPIELTFSDRDNTFGLPPIPRTIAATNVDLPVPFGPIITFRYSPG